jgi:diguanylate cyclase
MVMEVRYNPTLVTLSILVAIFASYVALNLANSITQAKGRARSIWLGWGALAMGIGIWSMHFVGMLAFEMPGMAMGYDIPLFILSIVIAVAASALALFIVSRPEVTVTSFVVGGLAMAAAIAGMHYTGMYSMRMEATTEWNLPLVALSIAIAMIASFAALFISIQLRNKVGRHWLQGLASVLMGIAISGMHYTGMAAATFIHSDAPIVVGSNLLATEKLGIPLTIGTLLILGIALVGTIFDRALTTRTNRAEENERLFRKAQKAISDLEWERELRSRLVSALAHDLRTPLAAAQMSNQLGIRNSTDPDAVVEFSGRAIENLRRIDLMIQDLLDAHRISAGQGLPLNIERCDVPDFLEKTIENLTTVYGDRFDLDVDENIEVHWDCQYMRRVLENLCTNAIKYGRAGAQVKIAAQATPEENGSRLSISVHNEGEPLDQEDRQNLFELFSRGRNAQSSGAQGWGLGLTIVKGVSEAHGGNVRVESSPGQGTTFTIDVPLDARSAPTNELRHP